MVFMDIVDIARGLFGTEPFTAGDLVRRVDRELLHPRIRYMVHPPYDGAQTIGWALRAANGVSAVGRRGNANLWVVDA